MIAKACVYLLFKSEFHAFRVSSTFAVIFFKFLFALCCAWSGFSTWWPWSVIFLGSPIAMAVLSHRSDFRWHLDTMAALSLPLDCAFLCKLFAEPAFPCALAILLARAVFRLPPPHTLASNLSACSLVLAWLLFSLGSPSFQDTLFLLSAATTAQAGAWMLEQLCLRVCAERIALEREERKAGELLARMLPACASHQLKDGAKNIAKSHDCVTVLFAEIQDVSEYADMPGEELLALLNDVYYRFDRLMQECCVYKIETVGEVYVCCSGLPMRCPEHAERCAAVGFKMLTCIQEFSWPDGKPMRIKVGMSTGEIVSGVIGVLLPWYRLFGDTINTTSRMCTKNPHTDRIMCSEATAKWLEDTQLSRSLQSAGERVIKGKGMMKLFYVTQPASWSSGDQGHLQRILSAEPTTFQDADVEESLGYEVGISVRAVDAGQKRHRADHTPSQDAPANMLAVVAFHSIILMEDEEELHPLGEEGEEDLSQLRPEDAFPLTELHPGLAGLHPGLVASAPPSAAAGPTRRVPASPELRRRPHHRTPAVPNLKPTSSLDSRRASSHESTDSLSSLSSPMGRKLSESSGKGPQVRRLSESSSGAIGGGGVRAEEPE